MNYFSKLCVAGALLLAAATSFASFHTFRIDQIYSNADGTVQFVVMREAAGANGENFWAGQSLTSTRAGVPKVYVFPNNLPGGGDEDDCIGYYCTPGLSPTANKRVLIATQGFAALGIVTPDYVIQNGFLPTDGGTLNFAGVDQVTYASLPTDGTNAINRNGVNVQNVATNFAGNSASVSPQSAPAVLNFQGMWYKAPAESEAGWGVNFAHQGDAIFATWFTHDTNRQAWNLSLSAFQTGPNTFAGTLVVVTGPPFGTVPFNTSQVHAVPVGPATLTFSDANNGTFTYTVNGLMQTKSITRQVFGVLPVCTWGGLADLTLATNYTDMWWVVGGVESGWGINFTDQGGSIFATWFTFDLSGNPLPMSATLVKVGPGNTYSGTLIKTGGPPFSAVPWNPGEVTRAEPGTATVTFTNGNRATFTYTVALNGPMSAVTQTKQLERQVFRTKGTTCQ